jgi:hypothetical protein
LGFRVILLQRLDAAHEIWFNNQGMERTLGNNMQVHFAELFRRGSERTRRNNMKVQLAEFFMKKGLNFSNLEVVAI